MKNNAEVELIRELLGLYTKYGREKFLRATAAVKSGEATKDIVALAAATEVIISSQGKEVHAESAHVRKEPTRLERLASFLSQLRAGDTGLVEIADFVENIAKGQIITQGAALVNFARSIGIEANRSKIDRVALAQKIGQSLIELTEPERRNIISNWHGQTTKSSLQGWTDIIVKRGNE